jgi:hypothetical protein
MVGKLYAKVFIFYFLIFTEITNFFALKTIIMCSKIICRKCKKPTWSGCGEHIEEALAGIAKADRCQGHKDEPKKSGLFNRLLNR